MKQCRKLFSVFAVLLLLIQVLPAECLAYNFEEDLFSSDPVYQNVMDQLDTMYEGLYPEGVPADIVGNADPDYGQTARKLYLCSKDEFRALVQDGIQEDSFDSLSVHWLLPVEKTDEGCHYIEITRVGKSGFTHKEVSTIDAGYEQVQFLFDPAMISGIIAQSQTAAPEQVVLLGLPYVNVVLFSEGETLHCIPFAARADLMGLENGTVYTPEDLLQVLDAFDAEREGSQGSAPFSGGGAQTDSGTPVWVIVVPVCAIVLLVAAVIVLRRKPQKTAR